MTAREQATETLAEWLSWTSGEMTRYSPDAHPDHNRWSWRGDGHGEAMRETFCEQAEALAPLIAERERAAAERAWDEGYDKGSDDTFDTRNANPYRRADQ